jgi:hypothetical protein
VGDYEVQVTVTDTRGDRAQATSSVLITDNSAPSIEVLSPSPDVEERYVVDDLIVFAALVDDAEEDPTNLVVSVSSSIQGDLGFTASPASDGSWQAGGSLEAGTHLLTYRVEDSYGQSAQGSSTVLVVENGPPSIEAVSIDPSTPDTEDTLTALPQGWDSADDAEERYRYAWYKWDPVDEEMVLDPSEVTDTFPSGKTTKGDLIQVRVTPYNDYGNGLETSSAAVEIVNSPPTAPEIAIDPEDPEPTENLYCEILAPSYDADGDDISYSYTWYRNGVETSITTSVVTSDQLADGDTWECVVTPNDGEDDGDSASSAVSVEDVSAPSAPVLNTPAGYRNEELFTLTGVCEAACELTIYCADAVTSWVVTDTCDGDGTFDSEISLSRGETTSCFADCTDAAGNTSDYSNTVGTEVCDPEDVWENSAGLGDAGSAAINDWSALSDSGASTITIEGNILDGDSEDWFVISTTDDVASDRAAGINYYNFDVTMFAGTSDYAFQVYKGTYDPLDMECSDSAGYTEYNDFVYDRAEAHHSAPTDTRSCGYGLSTRNECEDMSQVYYIRVFRLSTTPTSCQHYQLEITNGVW